MALMTAWSTLIFLLSIINVSQQACYFGADIALVLDIGEKANNIEMEEVRAFGKSILDLIAGHGRSQASLVTYRSEAIVRFTFEDWMVETARSQFFNVFRMLQSEGNLTHHGMWLLKDKVFSVGFGARNGIEDVVILVTNRQSSDINEAGRRAKLLQDKGTVILVIAIGDDVSNPEIQKYASRPDYHIRVNDFSKLEVAFNSLKKIAFDCSPCPEGWIKSQEDDGNCYRLVNNKMSWKTAKDNCDTMELGSSLIAFESAAQVKWFADEFAEVGDIGIWIGVDRNAAWEDFVYVNANALDETIISWKPGYPKSGLCVHYSKLGLQDDNCNKTIQSVCQIRQAYIQASLIGIR